MRGDRSLEEVAWILEIGGIRIESGVSVPDDAPWGKLPSEHEALFIGLGLGSDRPLDLPGAGLAGVEGAVAWIESMKLSRLDVSSVRRSVVLGGGNTAVDAVRECLGLGIPEVTMV